MDYKKNFILSLLMVAASAVHAEESSPVTQLLDLGAKPAAIVASPPPAKVNASPIKNFGAVIWKDGDRAGMEGLVFRGGQPEGREGYGFLGQLGVKTVINMRTQKYSDQAQCSANGIECLDYSVVPFPGIPIKYHGNFKRAFARASTDMEAGRKVFVYCQGGRHRTGALVSALLIRKTACGKTYNKAELKASIEAMLKDFGFFNICGKILNSWANDIREWVENPEDNKWICE
jgi:hypothetical protein